MTNSLDSTLSPCARCRSPYGLHPEFGFCPRCAAVVSFTETETAQPEEDELAAVLPRSTAATGAHTRFGDYEPESPEPSSSRISTAYPRGSRSG